MEAFTSDKECLYYMKLLTFTLGIGMDVLHNYFEQKILNATEFYLFLETHKHYLFHECYPRVQCCCCSNNCLASSSKFGCLNKSQFQLLFDIASPNENDHCQIGRHNEITKDCLCRIDAKRSNEVDCMDITLMCAIIKSCFVDNNRSIHGNPRDFETIKNTRNFLAHVSGKRISESDFNSKWDEMEQAILAIARAVGNYFAKATKRKINEFNSNELSMEKIKEIIESNADDVKKNLRALIETQRENTLLVQHVKDEMDELSVDIGKLRFEVKQYSLAVTPSSQEETLDNQGRDHKIDTTACVSDVKMSGKDKDVNKCRLEWRLETPDTWNLTEIKETLERFSGVLRPWFEIQFVYIGSLVIKTLVQKKILNDRDQMRTSVHSFLEKFVEVCQINTDVPKVIKIALIVEPDAFDYEVLETEDKPVESATSGENWDDEIEDIEIPVDNPYKTGKKTATQFKSDLYKLPPERAASTESAPKYRSSPENEIQKENMKRAKAMSATGSVRGFTEFDDLCRGCQGYSYNLASLFDICDHDQFNRHTHTISFKEAFKRLKLTIKESFSNLEIQTERKVTDFTIGKTFVKQKPGVYFNPMKPITWSLGGGINGRWQDYKNDEYDGLIVLACIERDLIPQNIKECYKRAIQMNKKKIALHHQNYALALGQALIQYYAFIKPDERMRNQSFDIGNLSKEICKGGIVYVAYKLDPEPSYSDDEFEAHDNSVPAINVKQAAIDRLNLQLKKNGLYFCCDISNDGNSFFRACSDQLSRLELAKMDHLQLRQLIIPQLRDVSDEKKESINLANESWETYLTTIEKEGNVVGDIVVETMAKYWRRKIVIYSRSYPDEITEEFVNEEAWVNGPPLLLAKEKLYYQSLKRGDGNVEVKGESTILKRPAKNVHFADDVSLAKQPKLEKEVDRNAEVVSSGKVKSDKDSHKSTPVKILQAGPSTEGASTKSNTKQVNTPMKKITKDEKLLILRCYHALEVKNWDKLVEMVYNKRYERLSREIVHHYEQNLDLKTTLKSRIKDYVTRVKKDKGKNEKDPDVKALIQLI
ncbi:uncharacterized protein [Mytilus edulis]|uniref:uncharacterized protein isoform X5 n=1 Tax=Mytilus edulis TaxID=6550 RepID=UPI0039F13DFA